MVGGLLWTGARLEHLKVVLQALALREWRKQASEEVRTAWAA